jgi:hypothetical protein
MIFAKVVRQQFGNFFSARSTDSRNGCRKTRRFSHKFPLTSGVESLEPRTMLDASNPAAIWAEQFVDVSISDSNNTADSQQSASFESSSETEISWNDLTGSSQYEILIYSTSRGQEALRVDSLNAITFQPVSLSGPDSFQLFVRATDESGDQSRWSNPVYFDIAQPSAISQGPETPSFIAVTGDTLPALEWTPSATSASYELLIYSITAGQEAFSQDGLTEGSLEVASLENADDEFQAFVRASNSDGDLSPWSEATFFTVGTDLEEPQEPVILNESDVAPQITNTVTIVADTTPTIAWTEVESAAYYQVQVYNVATGSLILDVVGMSQTETTLSQLSAFGTHVVYVRAFAADGQPTGWSDPFAFNFVNLQDDVSSGELLKEMIYQEIPELRSETMDDFTRVNLLREWAFRNIDWGIGSTLRPSEYFSQSAPAVFSWYFQDRAGTFCGGAAYALKKLYHLFGCESYTIGFGNLNVMTHTSTLVRIQHEGRSVLSVQDVTFNFSYSDAAGNPYDYLNLLETLRNSRHDLIFTIEGTDHVRETVVSARSELGNYRQFLETDFSQVERISSGWLKFNSMLTYERFNDVYGPQINPFLAAEGYPQDTLYLYLYPFQCDSTALLGQAQAVVNARI